MRVRHIIGRISSRIIRARLALPSCISVLLLSTLTWAEAPVPTGGEATCLAKYLAWPVAVFVGGLVLFLILLRVAPEELRGLITRLNELSYRGVSIKLDNAAKDAFSKAAEAALSRPLERLEDFTDEDFKLAKNLDDLAGRHTRPKLKRLVDYLVDFYQKVRQEPFSDERTRRKAAVVAQMRLLGFAGHPMVKELTSGEKAGARVAAIAFVQVKPCYDLELLDWLADRLSPEREEPFVQYNALIALVKASRNVEPSTIKLVLRACRKAREGYNATRPEHRTGRADLFTDCEMALRNTPFYPSGGDAILFGPKGAT